MDPLTRPRIVCVGANLESQVALEGLTARGANIVGIVTIRPDDAIGISDYIDLRPLAAANSLPVVLTRSINSPAAIEAIRELAPDFLFTLGWSEIFREELLKVPRRFTVGSHPSPLPAGRGRAPVPWTILEGLRRSAVSLFRMSAGVDDGPILLQRWFEVPDDAYAGDLYQLVAENLRDAYSELYAQIEHGTVTESPQPSEEATFRARRTPADGHLDFSESASRVYALIRAVSHPFPGAYAYHEGKRMSVWRASLKDVPRYSGVTGQILTRSDDRLLVQAGGQPLWIHDLTSDGNPIDSGDLRIGSRFGFAVEDEIWRLRREMERLKELLENR